MAEISRGEMPMTERQSWSGMRERRMQSPEARDAYEMSRRAHEFGVVIRAQRERQGMTQAQVATIIATSQSAIARLEAGGVQPTLETLSRLSAALGIRLVVGPDGVVAEPGAVTP